jgi:hypothetical protein
MTSRVAEILCISPATVKSNLCQLQIMQWALEDRCQGTNYIPAMPEALADHSLISERRISVTKLRIQVIQVKKGALVRGAP